LLLQQAPVARCRPPKLRLVRYRPTTVCVGREPIRFSFIILTSGYQMLQKETTIVNKLGLHARASAKLTQLAGNYQSEIWMSRNGRRINAKSIMGVMMLAAGIGSTVTLETEGPDEAQAMEALLRLIADKFGEGQ
jgi:phosphocarrier protein